MSSLTRKPGNRRSPLRALNRRLDRYTTRMQFGERRKPDNPLGDACRAFRLYFRWRKRFAKLMPGFFDYATAERRARNDAANRQFELELQAALERAYGSKNTGKDEIKPSSKCKSV